MSTVATEHVLVVPTSLFHDLGYFQGFHGDADRYLRAFFAPGVASFRPRPEMESDPGFKQLIPYCLFRHTDEEGVVHLFEYTRGTGQGEGRLHRKRSVGVGGHISTIDADVADEAAYALGLRRELDEEVEITSEYSESRVGLINDDETEVGRVHLGVVHLFDLDRPAMAPRETDLLSAGFRPVDELLADLTGFETWSAICIRAIFGGG